MENKKLALVSHELAEKLKEAGYDWWCSDCYDKHKRPMPTNDVTLNHLFAPSQELAKQWFLKKHRLYIEVTMWGDGIGITVMIKRIGKRESDEGTPVYPAGTVNGNFDFDQYDRALELGLLEAHKLIKK